MWLAGTSKGVSMHVSAHARLRGRQATVFAAAAPSRPRAAPRRAFFTPPVAGADLRAALVASCLRGALPPVLLLRKHKHG